MPRRRPRTVRRRPSRRVTGLLAALVLMAGCSGGGGGGGSGPTTPGENGPASLPAGTGDFALLPTGNDANVPAPDFAQRDNGPLHAAYADVAGNVHYARCDAGCNTIDDWSSVVVAETGTGPGGFVVTKLALGSDGEPRIAFYVAPGTFDAGTTWFMACDGDCLTAGNWSAAPAHAHGDAQLPRELADQDWFALDELDRPRMSFLEPTGAFSVDPRVVLVGCDAACTSAASWRERDFLPEPLQSNAPVSIAFGPGGGTHLSYVRHPIGGDSSTLVWVGCPGDCLDAGAEIVGPTDLLVRADGPLQLDETSLVVDPRGAPAIVSFEDVGNGALVLLRCDGDCGSSAGWTQLALGERLVHDVDVASFGRGIDARFRGDALELAYTAQRPDHPVTDLVVRARCDAECLAGRADAPARVVATTDIRFDDQPPCSYVGTYASAPLGIVERGVGFVATPEWVCGSEPVPSVDPEGNPYVDQYADTRYLQLGAFAAER